MTRTYGFRLATGEECPAVTLTIADASAPLPVSQWLVPNAEHRPGVLYADAADTVEHAMTHGQVWTVPDHTAVAVLLHDDLPATTEGTSGRVGGAWGTFADRVRTLREAIDVHRPTTAHCYLAFLAVSPTRQGTGLGTALLRRLIWHLDHDRVTAFAVAGTQSARGLLQSRGFRDRSQRIDLSDRVQVWPMWRSPGLPQPAEARPE